MFYTGYNSKVGIFNLAKLRRSKWYTSMQDIFTRLTVSEHENDYISAKEQDYLNEYFYYHPG